MNVMATEMSVLSPESRVFPPSYSEATGQHASLGGGLSFIDFAPKCVSSGGVFSTPTFENFRSLVIRANDWLMEHTEWEVKTCESVEFKTSFEVINTERMTYLEHGEQSTRFVRAFRMWLVPRVDVSRPSQQIDYINLIPQQTGHAGLFGMPTFESLHELLERYNFQCRQKAPPGRVLTVETQEMKIPSYSNFDPDRSYWRERGGRSKHFLFVVRVFYEKTSVPPDPVEEIGVADFVPITQSTRRLFFNVPQYEPFSHVVWRASQWCAQQTSLRFCNAQSIEIKMKSGVEADTARMCYTEHAERLTFYVRVLRVAYAKQASQWLQALPPPIDASLRPPPDIPPPPPLPCSTPLLQLSCKTFVPLQLTRGFMIPEFESLSKTKKRVEAWVKATGARVLSAETVAMRLYQGGGAQAAVEASVAYNHGSRNEYWIFVVRVYLDGQYEEPPLEALPAVPPPTENNGCCTIM